MQDLTAPEYFYFEEMYRDSPWGPYIDGIRHAQSLMPWAGKKATIESFRTPWGGSPEPEIDGEDLQKIIDQENAKNGVDMQEFLIAEKERLAANG